MLDRDPLTMSLSSVSAIGNGLAVVARGWVAFADSSMCTTAQTAAGCQRKFASQYLLLE
jgi:hypothetical protein